MATNPVWHSRDESYSIPFLMRTRPDWSIDETMSKQSHEWTEDDLLGLISNKAQESLTLEFKACGALRDKGWRHEFAKDVSAFANSAGGVLIYGLKENKHTHEAEEIDDGFNPTNPSKEQLEQIVNSNIHRRIDGIRFNAISLSRTRPEKVAYVISVPESSHAPHMANHRFYKRFEYESVSMEEFEVRERYRRETYPSRDIVRAWFDDGINPLLSSLMSEQGLLSKEHWTWSHMNKSFNGLNENIGIQLNRSANQDDFLQRYPEVSTGLREHDRSVQILNGVGETYFNEVATSPSLSNLVKLATSIRALKLLQAEYKYKLTGNNKEELIVQLFGSEGVTTTRLRWIAEYAINQQGTFQNDMQPFWERHRERFFQIPTKRTFNRTRQRVIAARAELSKMNQALITTLEQTRKTLSQEHGVPFEETRHSVVYERYPMGLSDVYRY